MTERGGVQTRVLPDDINAPATARQFVAERLRAWPADRLDEVLLCVSELATNALVHAVPDVVLGLQVGPDAVTVAVTDRGGELSPPAVDPDPEAARGRGLHLVSLLAAAWGVRAADDGGAGKTVWCEVPLVHPPRRPVVAA